MLTDFYIAFSPVCFSLLALWLVVIQIHQVWVADEPHWRRSYAVSLHFALPGMMSLLALIEPQNPDVWRISFACISLGGAAVLLLFGSRSLPGSKRVDHVVQAAAIALYLAIGVLACLPGGKLHVEAVLLIMLVFLGFNVAMRLMYTVKGDSSPQSARPGGPPIGDAQES
jgi:hypothetical protein